ncbi:MAG TPA: TolC family protein [Burkholderiales bacterium]|nr:TolC family protein [Burkholderiales bacterium]
MPATGDRWWTLYGDPALERLVEEALAHNQDLAAALARPIFQGGRLAAEIEAVTARERQALEAERARSAALAEALRLTRTRHESGLASQLEVLDAERNLLQSELNRAEALRALRAAVADLVRALGGGWSGLADGERRKTEGGSTGDAP